MNEDVARGLLRDLIRAGPEPRDTLEVARRVLDAAGADVRVDDGAGTLVARVGATPRLAFSGHVDIVPTGDGWEHGPHDAVIADDRIVGRGACDMLGSIAAFLPVARLGVDVAFILTTDEETTMRGAEHLLENDALAGIDAIVVGEPTDFEIGIAEKGVLWFDVIVAGESAHASMPHLGSNAIMGLARGLAALSEWHPGGAHAALGEGTSSVGVIAGGTQANVVPERARARFDIRYLPGDDPLKIVEHVRRTVADASGLVTTARVHTDHAPFEARAGAPLVTACREAVKVTGRTVAEVGLPYGTEASKFQALPVDLVVLGPGERALAHTNRESITLADLDAGARMYAALARTYSGA